MTRRRVPGANGQLARHTLPFMLAAPDVEITLYLRHAARLDRLDRSRVRTLTQKGEPFVGHDIALDSLSNLIVKLVATPGLHDHCSLGVSDT